VSTIGEQRRLNYALQPMSRDAFVALVTADQPQAPAYFAHDAVLNRQRRQTLTESLTRALTPLSVDQVLGHARGGAQLLDTRDPDAFAAGHVRGSLNISLGGDYAVWAGTLLDRVRPIVVVAEPGREEESVLRLGRIGFDHVAGYLEGGPAALAAHPHAVQRTSRDTAESLARRLAASEAPYLLDVRAPREREQRVIPGSTHVPLPELPRRLSEVPRHRPVVVHCAAGYRSSIAASLLRGNGFEDVSDLAGGIQAWDAAHAGSQAG
jgi:rhodanese-related sulfurtransferase